MTPRAAVDTSPVSHPPDRPDGRSRSPNAWTSPLPELIGDQAARGELPRPPGRRTTAAAILDAAAALPPDAAGPLITAFGCAYSCILAAVGTTDADALWVLQELWTPDQSNR